MISIFELGYRYLIPSIKRRLVERLIDIGLTRKEAARRLGLSVSAISRYLSMKRGAVIDLASHNNLDEAISKLAIAVRDNCMGFYDIQL
jgi:predicted transcriptional regulator